MDLSLLETLRYKMTTGKDFAKIFEYFFDNFGENPAFFEVGVPAEDEMLTSLLSHVAGAMFKTSRVVLGNMRLIAIKEYDFIHGGLTINGAIASVIYRTDLRQGIVSVFRPNREGQTDFARFSAEMLP